jgi:1,4-dihydroxy-2-naphthoate octaprenyltransferase
MIRAVGQPCRHDTDLNMDTTPTNEMEPELVGQRLAVSGRPHLTSSTRARISAYARLANVRFYYHWYPVIVAWLLLPHAVKLRPGTLGVFGFALIAAASLGAAGGSLDDLEGTRDNLDQNTYATGERMRSIRAKPLLLGELTERNAERFGHLTAAVGIAAAVAAVVVAPHPSLLVLGIAIVSGLAAVQYSYGLKLSYRGLGECLIAYCTAVTAVIPYALTFGRVDARITTVAILLGCWFMQIPVFSNMVDAEKDLQADRRTLANQLAPRTYARYIVGLFVFCWVVTAQGFSAGWVPPLLAIALSPVWVTQVRQLLAGLRRGDVLQARLLGTRAYDLALAGLSAVLLITNRL